MKTAQPKPCLVTIRHEYERGTVIASTPNAEAIHADLETAARQCAAKELGVPVRRVSVIQVDRDLMAVCVCEPVGWEGVAAVAVIVAAPLVWWLLNADILP